MIEFEDGSRIDHCFCYMTPGTACKRDDCSSKWASVPYERSIDEVDASLDNFFELRDLNL